MTTHTKLALVTVASLSVGSVAAFAFAQEGPDSPYVPNDRSSDTLSDMQRTPRNTATAEPRDPLTIALRDGINHAAALEEYADNRDDDELDTRILDDHVELIGRSLEVAERETAKMEERFQRGTDAMETYGSMRSHQRAAGEPYRALQKETAKPKPSSDAIESAAEDLKDELKEAAAAHRELIGVR